MGDRDWRTDPSVFRDLDDQWGGALTGRRQVVVSEAAAKAAGTSTLPADVLARAADILAADEDAAAEADAFEQDVVGVPPLPRSRPTLAELALVWGDPALARASRQQVHDVEVRARTNRRRRFDNRLAAVARSTGRPASKETRARLWEEESSRVGLAAWPDR